MLSPLKLSVALLASLVFLSSCSTIKTEGKQEVSIDTPACPKASCTLRNLMGTYEVPSTPGIVTVNRVCAKLRLTCSRSGEADFNMSVGSAFAPLGFDDILFGGIIIGPGLDTLTGAACEYPGYIPVPMSCGDGVPVAKAKKGEPPKRILDTLSRLQCENPEFITKGQESEVYTAECKRGPVILTCNTEGCISNRVEID